MGTTLLLAGSLIVLAGAASAQSAVTAPTYPTPPAPAAAPEAAAPAAAGEPAPAHHHHRYYYHHHAGYSHEQPVDKGPTTADANKAYMGGGVILQGAPGAPAPKPQATPPGQVPANSVPP